MRLPWWERWMMNIGSWWRVHVGILSTCYWCDRRFLWRCNGKCLTDETQMHPICSDECATKYARTL